MIRKPRLKEIGEIVNLHMENLKDGLLYVLGKEVLKIFYSEMFKDRNSFILAYYENGKIVGVAASTKDPEELSSKIRKKHFFGFVWTIILKSLENPILPLQILTSRYYSKIKPELMFLFVDKRHRGLGIGRELMRATAERFKNMKVKHYKITIVSSNLGGKKFYESIGFKKAGEFQFVDEYRDVFVYDL